MLLLILTEKFTIDLPANKMECFFTHLENPAELQGYYQVYPFDIEFPQEITFRISANVKTAVFESTKSEDTFTTPANAGGVYRFCFTTAALIHNETKLFFDLNVVEIQTERTSFTAAAQTAEVEMSKIQANYRNSRMIEQNLQNKVKGGVWRVWVWSLCEVAAVCVVLGVQTLWIIKLTK